MKVKSAAGQATCETWHAREMMNVLETKQTKEHCNVNLKKLMPHARDKIARVNACEVYCLRLRQ